MNKLKLNKDISYQFINDNCIIIIPSLGNMYFLNSTAGEIIEAISEEKTSEQIIDDFVKRYNINKHLFINDFDETINVLSSINIVETEKNKEKL